MTDDERVEPKFLLPRREAQAKQAIVAIAMIFFLGVAVGFALAQAL